MKYYDFYNDIKRPNKKNIILNASDYGMNTENTDNSFALRAAIDACAENNAQVLYIPKGRYCFTNEYTIKITNLKNILISAHEVEFIYNKPINFMAFENCECLEIHGLTVDWDWSENRIASLVRVVGYSVRNMTVDYEFLESGEININQPWKSANMCDRESFTPGCEMGREFDGFGEVEKISDKHYRVKIRNTHLRYLSPLFFEKGNIHLVRHYWYGGGVFSLNDCTHFSFTECNVYSSPGMAIRVTGHSHHLLLSSFKAIIRPGTDRHISIGVDVFHVSNSNGYIYIENSHFGGQGDDAVNINNHSLKDLRKTDKYTIAVPKRYDDIISERDILEFRNTDLSESGFTARVAEKSDNGDMLSIRLDSEIPPELNEFIIFNRAYGSENYIIKKCCFYENRARGVLMQADNGVLTDCYFRKIQGAAVQIETGISNSWSEGFGVSNILIENNIFENCDLNDWEKGVIYISSYNLNGVKPMNTFLNSKSVTSTFGDSGSDRRTASHIFKNIEIKNNIFKEFPRFAIVAASFENLIFENNEIINKSERKNVCFERGSVWLEYGEKAFFANNAVLSDGPSSEHLIRFHNESTDKIFLDGRQIK